MPATHDHTRQHVNVCPPSASPAHSPPTRLLLPRGGSSYAHLMTRIVNMVLRHPSAAPSEFHCLHTVCPPWRAGTDLCKSLRTDGGISDGARRGPGHDPTLLSSHFFVILQIHILQRSFDMCAHGLHLRKLELRLHAISKKRRPVF